VSQINGPRLLTRLEELSTHGRQPSGGVTRLAFSADDVKVRELVARWMRLPA
jgi:allantoate deiminase